MSVLYYESSLAHHGIRGMKWGIRRYQNKDGTLTPRGQKRYQKEMEKITREQNLERRRIEMERNKIKEARKTAQVNQKLQDEKAALYEEKKKTKMQATLGTKKPTSEMTNQELADLISRVQLEKQLAQLTAPPPKKINPLMQELGSYALKSLTNELTKAIGASATKAMTHTLDMERMDKEAEKQKKAWEREDNKYKRERMDKINDDKAKRDWDEHMEDVRWQNQRSALLEDIKFDLDHPYYVPSSKRSWKSEKKKDEDDD